MARDEELKKQWEELVVLLSNQFADGDTLDLDAIIYIIGLQEKGNLNTKYSMQHTVSDRLGLVGTNPTVVVGSLIL